MIFDIYDTLIITQVYRLKYPRKPLNIKLRGFVSKHRFNKVHPSHMVVPFTFHSFCEKQYLGHNGKYRQFNQRPDDQSQSNERLIWKSGDSYSQGNWRISCNNRQT